ncbi:MAG: hypothetical protein QOE03_3402 [Micromonosporaceae bacterium]|jgi:hypothetical protein|nr:hypothetical protein [Micromonosporaceae bacterium]
MASRTTKIAGVAIIAALTLSGCGKSAKPSTGSEPSSSMSSMGSMGGRMAAASAGADLRAGLTYLLTEHVYRAGIALTFAVDKGGNLEDPTVKAAVANLDANSVELSKAVGAAYPDAEAPFLQSWRQHIGFFVDYTLGKATKDQAKVDKAKADLDGYRTAFGQLINSVVPQLPATAVADELKPHVQTLTDAIDSLVAGDGQVFTKLQTAAGHMPMTAKTLATGIAANKKLTGDPNGAASELRSGLTYLLTSHVDLAGIAIVQAVAKGGDLTEPSVKAAVSALDANSVELSKAVGGAYPDAEAPFLQSWRQHIGFFVDYTLGKATKDQAKVDKAKADLDGYRTAFGQLINSVVPQLPATAVADELKPHVQTLTDAIDALVAGDPTVFTKLATAASHMPMTAATLAGGIADNKKLS